MLILGGLIGAAALIGGIWFAMNWFSGEGKWWGDELENVPLEKSHVAVAFERPSSSANPDGTDDDGGDREADGEGSLVVVAGAAGSWLDTDEVEYNICFSDINLPEYFANHLMRRYYNEFFGGRIMVRTYWQRSLGQRVQMVKGAERTWTIEDVYDPKVIGTSPDGEYEGDILDYIQSEIADLPSLNKDEEETNEEGNENEEKGESGESKETNS